MFLNIRSCIWSISLRVARETNLVLEAFVSFPVLESFPVEFIEVLAFRVSMLNGSLDSKAIYSKDKNLQQVMSKRRKVIDNAGQDAVAGGHIA